MDTIKTALKTQYTRCIKCSWVTFAISLMLSLAAQHVAAQTHVAGEIGYNFTGITTAWDNTTKTASVSTNTFSHSVTGSVYTLSTTSGRGNAIIDGQTKAMCHYDGNETHRFTITIPALSSGTYVSLTNLSFRFDTRSYDQPPPFTSYPAKWTLALSQGSASKTIGTPTTKTWTTESIVLSGLTGLNNTSVTFTITDMSGGNNKNTTYWTGFDDVKVLGEVVSPPVGMCISFF